MRPSDHQPLGEIDRDPVRALTIRRAKQKKELQAHAVSYVIVNLVQVGCWWFLTPDVFFWPFITITGWGIGLAFHIWAVASSKDQERIRPS